jgi:hypothetical protein
MRRPWSISTTVRNPERLRDFLAVLKRMEGQEFDEDNQVKYQVLLIQERLYRPQAIPPEFRKYYDDPTLPMPYEAAEQLFYVEDYEDPPMRGRQSANPLNKLGFAIARKGWGRITITELGDRFLAGDYDIGFIFFKSMLKLQFPNPWSTQFSATQGFNVMPFVATMHLVSRVNNKSTKRGLDSREFSVFVPTLTNVNRIDEHVESLLRFREQKDKDKYISDFAEEFYQLEDLPETKINNLFDYGDNTMRYFRLTRYFRVSMDPLGYHWTIDLEPSRRVEIEQLLHMYDGRAIAFESLGDYLSYLSDITKPELPWKEIEKLRAVAQSLKDMVIGLTEEQDIELSRKDQEVLSIDIEKLTKERLRSYISQLRTLNLGLKERLRTVQIRGDLARIREIATTLRDAKTLRKYQPEQFEKLITDALRIINDEVLIKPNYPVDDDGEPITHAPGNKPDVECYYQAFKAICEVTLNTSTLQWVQEGQPIMRHLREFEVRHRDDEVFCIFVAPRIHNDTYSQFWISVKYEYDGLPQRIVPMTTEQFAVLLETLLELVKQGRRFSHRELCNFYTQAISETKRLGGFSEWAACIPELLEQWQRGMISG